MDYWMGANEILPAEKKNVMLAVIGSEGFELLAALCTPGTIAEKTHAQLCKLLDGHFTQGTNELAESFNFDTRCQRENETVAEFIIQLKKISIHCGFGDADQVKKRLRNRLVAGVKAEAIKNKLLSEGAALTWKRAEDIATTMDVAHRDAGMMKSGTSELNKIKHGFRGKGKQHFQPQSSNNVSCFRCNGRHLASNCTYKNEQCYNCQKTGHISRACKSKSTGRGDSGMNRGRGSDYGRGRGRGRGHGASRGRGHANEVRHEENVHYEELSYTTLNEVMEVSQRKFSDEYCVEAKVNDVNITFALDTCSKFTVVEEDVYYKHFSQVPLIKPSMNLRSYSGHEIGLLGQIWVDVEYEGQKKKMMMVIAKGKRTPLFGRDWLSKFKLNWQRIFAVQEAPASSLESILKKHKKIFSLTMGEIKDFEARIDMNSDAPRFFKARPVPYALQEPVKKEIDRLEAAGVLKKIERSEFASPQVVVPKRDGSLRLCGDYKVSINEHMVDQPYMLPTAEDLFATLAGGKKFSILDLSQAYAQVRVEERSQKYIVVNTIKGLYQVTRLPYGIKTAPHIFQSIMDQILQGIPGVCCYIDDILITAPSDEEHLRRLEIVMQRLEKFNVRVKEDKCSFLAKEVRYLGHVIDQHGRKPLPEKVRGIRESKPPTNVSELRTFLGMVNYYGRFLKSLSSRLAPLNNLLRDNVPWKWCETSQKTFEDIKKSLTSAGVLTHYDCKKKLILACDASPFGIGAVLSHDDNGERPVAFASRTLTTAEQKYSQIEKEALAIIYGVQKFHKYLYGRRFTLITDHNPLTYIFGPYAGIPTLAALRLQRWALLLSAYNYEIVYRKSADNANADYLSRAPVDEAVENIESEVNYFSHVNEMPITAEEIAASTRKDTILARVFDYTMNGWPGQVEDEYLPYHQRRNEISVDQGVLLWGMRVIVPTKLQERMLDELHIEHQGIVRMKALSQSYFWFPGIDVRLEALCKSCNVCLSLKKDPPPSPLYPWKYPERPWDRIHIDYAEFKGKMYFVCSDAHSKWLEVVHMKTTTSTKTIETMQEIFGRNGLPREVVSDNGPQFTSEEFKKFLQSNGVKQTLTAPYHPASNGLAERAVQTLKYALKKQHIEEDLCHRRLQSFLLTYRTTPHATTGVSPAELFFKRQLRTRLSLVKPSLIDNVNDKQVQMKKFRDERVPKLREFMAKETVRVKNCRGGIITYVPGVVIERKGPVQYLVRVGQRTRFAHVDHLLKTGEAENISSDIYSRNDPHQPEQEQVPIPVLSPTPSPSIPTSPTPSPTPSLTSSTPRKPQTSQVLPSSKPAGAPVLERPRRNIKPPARFNTQEFELMTLQK